MTGPMIDASRWLLTVLHTAGWGLVYSLVVGGGLGVLLWLLLAALRDRSAWARYALCCGAIVLLTGVFAQSFTSIRSAYSGHTELVESYASKLMAQGAPEPVGDLPGGWTPEALSREVEVRHDHDLSPWLSGSTAYGLGSLLALLATLWLLVACGRLLSLGRAHFALQRLATRATTPVDQRWERLMADLRTRLDVWHPVSLAVSPHVDSPMLIGWWKPTILLSVEAHDRLDDAEAEAVLAHELAHIRRGDYAVNLLQSAVEAVFYFHPVTWWLGQRIREEREFCSDDLAHRSIDGGVGVYLRALATLEGLRGRAAPDLAMAANGRPLLRRMQRLAALDRNRRRPRVDVDLLLVVAALVALWIPTLHAARSVEAPTVAVMKHDMRLPRDFERVAAAAGVHAGSDREVSHD